MTRRATGCYHCVPLPASTPTHLCILRVALAGLFKARQRALPVLLWVGHEAAALCHQVTHHGVWVVHRGAHVSGVARISVRCAQAQPCATPWPRTQANVQQRRQQLCVMPRAQAPTSLARSIALVRGGVRGHARAHAPHAPHPRAHSRPPRTLNLTQCPQVEAQARQAPPSTSPRTFVVHPYGPHRRLRLLKQLRARTRHGQRSSLSASEQLGTSACAHRSVHARGGGSLALPTNAPLAWPGTRQAPG